MLAAEKLLLLPTDMTGDFTRSDVHTLHEVRVLAIIRKMMGEGMKFDTVDNRMCIHQGTDPLEIPPPFMAKTILNFHFDYWNPSLSIHMKSYIIKHSLSQAQIYEHKEPTFLTMRSPWFDYQQRICHALCLWVGFLKPKTSCKNIVLFA